MVKTHVLMESISANLGGFLNLITPDLEKPQKKFIRDAVIGLIRAGRPIVCRMARNLPKRRAAFLSRLDRLENDLNPDRALLTKASRRPCRSCGYLW